jgi:hypothetical protein
LIELTLAAARTWSARCARSRRRPKRHKSRKFCKLTSTIPMLRCTLPTYRAAPSPINANGPQTAGWNGSAVSAPEGTTRRPRCSSPAARPDLAPSHTARWRAQDRTRRCRTRHSRYRSCRHPGSGETPAISARAASSQTRSRVNALNRIERIVQCLFGRLQLLPRRGR